MAAELRVKIIDEGSQGKAQPLAKPSGARASRPHRATGEQAEATGTRRDRQVTTRSQRPSLIDRATGFARSKVKDGGKAGQGLLDKAGPATARVTRAVGTKLGGVAGRAAAGLGKLAAAAGPVGIAVAAAGVAAVGTAVAFKKASDALRREAERLADVSPSLAIATAEAELQRELGQRQRDMRRAEEIGPKLEELIAVQTATGEVWAEIRDAILTPLMGLAADVIVPTLKAILEWIVQIVEFVASDSELAERLRSAIDRLESEDMSMDEDPFFRDFVQSADAFQVMAPTAQPAV